MLLEASTWRTDPSYAGKVKLWDRQQGKEGGASLSAANTVNDPGITIRLSRLSIFHASFEQGDVASFGRSQNPGYSSVWKYSDPENIIEQSVMTADMPLLGTPLSC